MLVSPQQEVVRVLILLGYTHPSESVLLDGHGIQKGGVVSAFADARKMAGTSLFLVLEHASEASLYEMG